MREVHILLVRHPETIANVTGRLIGRGESNYTPEGRRQLMRVPRKIAAFEPTSVWTSPLTRTRRLADKTAQLLGIEACVDERLIELDFGRAEGMTFDEIAAAGMQFDYRNRERPVAPEGESRDSIERRSAEIMDEIVALGGRHAVVTHGGVFRASLVHLLGLSSSDIWAFHIHNAQLGHVRVVDGHGMLEEYVQG